MPNFLHFYGTPRGWYCRGGKMNNKGGVFGPLCRRRGLLAYVYSGVSLTMKCLSGGKWLLYSTAQCW